MKRVLITNYQSKEGLETLLNGVLDVEFVINYQGNVALLELYDEEAKTGMPLINSDFLVELKIMYVPLFDDFMIKLLRSISSPGIYNAYQVMVKALLNGRIVESDIPDYLEKLSPETIQLIKIFIETDLNASRTARMMYMHRNTLNYRLDHFKMKTGIDIREYLNANFIYFLLILR